MFNLAEGWILYIFYVLVAIFAVISSSQFWIFANLIFNAREAKRLFGLIGAGAIAGGIFGGYLTNFLAPIIRSENLIFFLTWWIIIFEGATGDITFIGHIYRGYNVSPVGSIFGLIWGFFDALIGGAIFA